MANLAVVQDVEAHPLRLNLGAGRSPIDGYDNSFDIGNGKKAWPLQVPDACADEIRASHIFEHFSHTVAAKVMADWVRALKPGGLMKIAVPDFEYIARGYGEGRPENWQGYVCGGHENDRDIHLAQYDFDSLSQIMRGAGLVGIHKWKGERDCSSLPVSLNLAAWKPPAVWPAVIGAMSVPRLGFMDNFFCAVELLAKLRIPIRKTTGAFWGQCITRSIEHAIEQGAEWILSFDYDSVYSVDTVLDLLITAIKHPQVDALVPLQMSRRSGRPLMTVLGPDGKAAPYTERSAFDETILPIATGHFGLTLLRASKFAGLPKPWFVGKPDANGTWSDERVDEDIHFWNVWRAAGNAIHCAPRCVIGHAELEILWPDRNLEITHQYANDFSDQGEPRNVWR
jgi:hypothetical protein